MINQGKIISLSFNSRILIITLLQNRHSFQLSSFRLHEISAHRFISYHLTCFFTVDVGMMTPPFTRRLDAAFAAPARSSDPAPHCVRRC
jgi:hypothetical protein